MSPSVMTRMESSGDGVGEGSASHLDLLPAQTHSHVPLEVSTSTLSSVFATTIDLPEVLDEYVKETFLLGFSSAVIHSAIRDLSTIREAVLGAERIKSLIVEGCSPEQIGYMIASKKELLDGFKSVEGDVRDLALGFTVVQVAAQFEAVSVTDDPSLDSTRLRRFQKMAQDMRVDLPKNVLEFPKIDYTSLQSFVLEEKTNGSLVGDPAWEELAKRNLKSWKQHLQSSLEKLNRDFQQAAEEVNWTASSQMDTDLLQALPASALIRLTLENYDSASVRLSLGPTPKGKTADTIVDAENLSKLGRDFRSDVLDFCKQMANDEYKRERYKEAEKLYHLALKAGSNDATVTINRAAALLKLEEFKEAQHCCTIGLMQLDIAKLRDVEVTEEEEKQSEGKAKLVPCHRSRPMLASQETLDELRWKAFVRRGRANKGNLMQLGGLSGGSGSGQDVKTLENIGKDGSVKLFDDAEEHEQEHDTEEESKRAEERGRLLLAARSDFAAALRLDPLDDIPRHEMASLTILPLQRRPSIQDISKGLALSSISQVDQEQKRYSQELAMPAKPRRSESS